jgi:hypothetical protein
VIEGAKPAARQGFYPQELAAVESFCQEHSLVLVRPKFKIVLTDTKEEGEYSNRGEMVPESDPRKGMHFVYISKSEEAAYYAAYFEQTNNIRGLGRMLGYPDCCIDFFEKSFSENSPEPMHRPKNIYTDLTKRSKDITILSHFPCCSDCRSSISLARRYLEIIRKNDPEHAAMIESELSMQTES